MNVNKREQKNRSLRLLFLPMIIVLMLLGGVAAYAALTSREEKENNFAIGNLESKIDEVFDKPTSDLTSGDQHPKLVNILNSGTMKQFVRVMIQPEMLVTTAGGDTQVLPAAVGKEVLLDINVTDWTYGEDGYYYYVKAIEPQAKSSQLFSTVELASGLGETYDKASFKITLKVEAASTGGDKASQYGIYQDVWWKGLKPTSDRSANLA